MTKTEQHDGFRTLKQLALGLFIGMLFVSCAELIPKVLERYLPFEHYVDIQSITVSDVVVGDKYQSGVITREVRNGEGVPIDVIAELMLVGVTEDGEDTKIFYTTQRQFLEHSEDSTIAFRENLPPDLEAGTYYWIYGFTLNINNHLFRSHAVRSNDFQVKAIDDLIENNDMINDVDTSEGTNTPAKSSTAAPSTQTIYVPVQSTPAPAAQPQTVILRENNTTVRESESEKETVREVDNDNDDEQPSEPEAPEPPKPVIPYLLEKLF